MKKFIFAIVSFLFINAANAQFPSAGEGTIKGIVSDSITSSPVAFATVGIYAVPSDTLVAGTLTDEKGNFLKEELANGNYTVKITCIGYKTIVVKDLKIDDKSLKVQLNNIKLAASSSNLGELTVTGQQKAFEQTFNKKIFLMDEKRNANAINVLDQLKTLPSITVDPDGNVKYRGQTPNILVDDQPYTLLYPKLEMIPAANVDKIEFIEPSARYESSVGTINIKLKQPKENGMSGAIYTRFGSTDFKSIMQNSNGLNINFKQKKLILFGNMNYNYWNGNNDYDQNVWLTYSDKVYISKNTGSNNYKSTNYSESVGMVYNFTKKKKLTFTWSPSQRLGKSTSNNIYNEEMNAQLREYYIATGNSKSHNIGNNFVLNYNKKFENEEKELSLKATYSLRDDGWDSHDQQTYTYHSFAPSDSIPRTFNENNENTNKFSFDSYYVLPIDSTGRWEIGTQSQITSGSNETNYYLNDIYFSQYSDRYTGFYMNHAAYSNLGTKWKKFKFDVGLRLALKTIDIDQTVFPNGTDSSISIKKIYPYAVPNATISYEIKPFHELKLNYQLDEQIPSEDQLSPYINKSSPRSWYSGNLSLKPYMYHRFSFGYMYAPGKYSVSLDAFTYFSNNYVEWINIPIDDYTTYSKPENVGKSTGTGITLSGSATPNDWFNFNFSTDIFKANVDASSLSSSVGQTSLTNTGLVTGNWSVTGNSYVSVFIKKKNSISVYLNYMGRNTSLGGYSKGSLYNGLYFSRRFLSNSLNVSVSINNLVDKYSRWSTTSDYFGRKEVSEYHGTWNKRTFGISLRYSFNKGDRGLLNTQTDDSGDSAGGKGGKGK
jgi:ferric enterobactin receptor